MNPDYFSIVTDNGTKIIIAHELYYFYKVETGFGHGRNANDFHHNMMAVDNEYENMLKEIFSGFTETEYDILKMEGTVGSSH